MRLFLSSQDLGNYAERAADLAGKNKKALFIKNAQDNLPADERNFSTPEKKKLFENVGFKFEEIDLREYFGKTDKLRQKLDGIGSFWSSGGNTFILRRAMKLSGLDKILKDLLQNDQILYGGWSAGACVAAKTLHGIEFGDYPGPDAVPESYPLKETIWDGLDLVPFMTVPHYKSDWFGKEADQAISYLKDHNLPYRTISDGQVIIIDGSNEVFLK